MQNKKNMLSLAISLGILFVFFIGLTNTLISSYVNDPVIFKERYEDIAAVPGEPGRPLSEGQKDDFLVPEDPVKYNIQVLEGKDLTLTQMQWDMNMRTALLHSKAAVPAEKGKKPPQKLKERLNRINRQIKDLEKRERKSPSDQTEAMKLQMLYMLKSSLTVLDETPVEKNQKKK